jgi:hypothetical protein
MYTKHNPLTFEQINEAIAYDPLTGIFTWKKAPSRRYKVGDEIGQPKSVRKSTGEVAQYRYIGFMGYQMTAARVAWLLTHKVWPEGNVYAKNDDTLDLRLENLALAAFTTQKSIKEGRRHYKLTPEAARHHGLKHLYGISVAEYNQMLADQGGVCAVCKRPETGKTPYGGPIKPLSVDHNHETNQVRGLLCTQCNYMIGHCRESEDILLAGAAYLRKYATRTATVTPLRSSEDQK